MQALGTFAVSVVLLIIGVFLSIAAYSRKEILLKLASLGMFRIDPDNPGRRQRAILFTIGVVLIGVGLALIVIEKLASVGVFD